AGYGRLFPGSRFMGRDAEIQPAHWRSSGRRQQASCEHGGADVPHSGAGTAEAIGTGASAAATAATGRTIAPQTAAEGGGISASSTARIDPGSPDSRGKDAGWRLCLLAARLGLRDSADVVVRAVSGVLHAELARPRESQLPPVLPWRGSYDRSAESPW